MVNSCGAPSGSVASVMTRILSSGPAPALKSATSRNAAADRGCLGRLTAASAGLAIMSGQIRNGQDDTGRRGGEGVAKTIIPPGFAGHSRARPGLRAIREKVRIDEEAAVFAQDGDNDVGIIRQDHHAPSVGEGLPGNVTVEGHALLARARISAAMSSGLAVDCAMASSVRSVATPPARRAPTGTERNGHALHAQPPQCFQNALPDEFARRRRSLSDERLASRRAGQRCWPCCLGHG